MYLKGRVYVEEMINLVVNDFSQVNKILFEEMVYLHGKLLNCFSPQFFAKSRAGLVDGGCWREAQSPAHSALPLTPVIVHWGQKSPEYGLNAV